MRFLEGEELTVGRRNTAVGSTRGMTDLPGIRGEYGRFLTQCLG